MDKVANLAMGLNVDVMKEPRGFIKPIQFILAIFAFATTCAPSSNSEFSVRCDNGTATDVTTVQMPFYYPFSLKSHSKFPDPVCHNVGNTENSPCCNFSSAPQFYVFVGVMAMLYSVAALVLYVKFDRYYRDKDIVPIVDFIAHIAFSALFLVASSAWADGLTKIKYNVNPDNLFTLDHVTECVGFPSSNVNQCTTSYKGNFAELNVSIIFGFLCCVVWGGNLWFLFKETKWSTQSGEPQISQQDTPQFSTPTVPSPDQGQI